MLVSASSDDVELRVRQRRPGLVHLHRLRRVGDDSFSGAGLYACSCGVVRPSM
jgi:hypothetical protein